MQQQRLGFQGKNPRVFSQRNLYHSFLIDKVTLSIPVTILHQVEAKLLHSKLPEDPEVGLIDCFLQVYPRRID